MKIKFIIITSLLSLLLPGIACSQHKDLRIVFIRHAEKPVNGDNLNCLGLNRSLLLPAVLFKKFGRTDNIYIPTIQTGSDTKHMRMLQTISPYAIKYNLTLNSRFDVDNASGIGSALLRERGTVLVVWEHQGLLPILKYLWGAKTKYDWPADDFDSIWIVTFKNGAPRLTVDRESLTPNPDCGF
jgi:hypothetical protein